MIEIISYRLKKRILVYVATVFAMLFLLILFSELWINMGFDINQVASDYNSVRTPIASMGYIFRIFAIFSNNYFIALLFMIPILDFLYLVGVMFNTALYFAYFSVVTAKSVNASPYTIAPFIVISPILQPYQLFFGFFEFLGYALTFSQGIYILIYLIKGIVSGNINELKNEGIYTVFIILFSAFILFAAATMESIFV
jgi:hypothetical protein